MNADDLINRFRFHKPNDEKAALHTKVRGRCYDLAMELNELLADSREKSLALTHLEEVMFWANASIARNGGGGE